MDNKLSELSKPVAEVVSKFGDPEAFGEREIKLLTGIQQMAYGTKFYSQEYVSALDKVAQFWIGESAGWKKRAEDAEKRIAELEAQVKVWESAALKHLARAEETEKRLPILEQDKLRLNEIINSEANRADAAEKRLATPVRLPDIRSDDYHETGWFQHMKYYRDVERSLRAVGFKVEEDE